MSAHTPGPWTQDKYGAVITPNGRILVTDGVAFSGQSTPETKANARLIAAAPELLEALKPFTALFANHHKNYADNHPVFGINGSVITVGDLRVAVAVIAKAEGDQA